jgi:YD repeat-containing protein
VTFRYRGAASPRKPEQSSDGSRWTPAFQASLCPGLFVALACLSIISYGADELQRWPQPPQTLEEFIPRPGIPWQRQDAFGCQWFYNYVTGWNCPGGGTYGCGGPQGPVVCHATVTEALDHVLPRWFSSLTQVWFEWDVIVRGWPSSVGTAGGDFWVYPASRYSKANLGNEGSEGPTDTTCKSPDPASHEGNPVAVATGNKFQRELDYASGGTYPLVFERYYNSQSSQSLGLGAAWSGTFFQRLTTDNPDVRVFAYRPNGRVMWFDKSGGQLIAGYGSREKLIEVRDASGALLGWDLVTADDATERYGANGRLVSIALRSGFRQVTTYDAIGRLTRVADDFGRYLQFTYDAQGRVSSIERPDTLAWIFTYDAQDTLVGVQYPDQSQKL